LKVET
jgi:hypothetical protein